MDINKILSKLFGNKSTRDMKEIQPYVETIKKTYETIDQLDNDALRAKTKELQPGESQTLTIDVDLYSLASFNDTVDQWETAAGNYTVKFGANVEDIRCTAPFKLAKEQTWKALDILKPEKEIKEIAVK